jgi:hypothetical protein
MVPYFIAGPSLGNKIDDRQLQMDDGLAPDF